MANDEKPTAELIQEFRRVREEEWSVAHTQFEATDSLYWRTFEVWPQKRHQGRPALRPSTASNIIDHAVDNQLAINPKITVLPANESEREKVRTGKVERFLAAVFEDASMQEPTLPFKAMQKFEVAYGYFVAEGPRLAIEGKPEEPERSSGEHSSEYSDRVALFEAQLADWSPFRIHAPHPSRVLLDPLEKRPTAGIKLSTRYAGELESLAQRKLKLGKTAIPWFKRDARPNEKVPVVEYFSNGWHALMVEGGELIFVERNTWGFCPFLHALAGWGMESTRPNDGGRAAELAVGVLAHIKDTLLAQAQGMSAEHELAVKMAFSPMGTTQGAAEMAQQLAKGELLEGQRADFWIMEQQQVMPWMFQIGERYERDIEAGTYAKAVRGVRETGVVTVGQQAILTNAAQRKFEAPQLQLNYVASIIAGRILRLVEVYGETITVRGQSLGPEDVGHRYAVRVRFELVDPIMQMQKDTRAMAEHDRGLLSSESYWEERGHEDPARERQRIYEDLLYKHPAVIEEGVRKVAVQAGLDKVLADWERRQKEAQGGGLVGPDGRPLSAAALRQPLGESGVVKPGSVPVEALEQPV